MIRSKTINLFWFLLMASVSPILFWSHLSAGTSTGTTRLRENKLAGLRPGQDTIENAYKLFKRDPDQQLDLRQSSWFDVCIGQRTTVAFNSSNVIQSVTIENKLVAPVVDCNDKADSHFARAKFGSSHCLLRHDSCERITDIYGTPDSKTGADSNRTVYLYSYQKTAQGPALTWEITCDTGVNQVYSLNLAVSAK
jgi:hypothetical protein